MLAQCSRITRGRQNLIVTRMTKTFRGLYRTIAWAFVTNGTMAFQVPETEYRAFGYQPDYDNLPWKESYNAAQSRGSSN
jgi:hypothetical protein